MSEIPGDMVGAIEATLIGVDRALDRLRDGTYQSCEHCGAPIAESLLAAEPLRTTCQAHPTLAG